MIKNYFFLTAGLLSFVFAAGHVYWGQGYVLTPLQSQGINGALLALVRMGWNLPAWTTFLSGIALIFISSRYTRSDGMLLAWFIVALNVGRYVLLLGTVISLPMYDVGMLAAQSAGVLLYVGLVYLGTRKRQAYTFVLWKVKD